MGKNKHKKKQLKISPVYLANLIWLTLKDIIANQGGTRSGKTFNIVWLLDDIAEAGNKGITLNGKTYHVSKKDSIKIDIVSQTHVHLKKGALADFMKIKKEIKGNWDDRRWHGTDKVYTYANGSTINFFSVDNEGKARGLGRDILYVNEINKGIKESIWEQLEIRTEDKILIDWNPSEPHHWIYDKITNREECKTLISTYLDNYDFLPKKQIERIERYKETDPVFWKVFGLGQRGNDGAGNVFKNWKEYDYRNFPTSQPIFGLDFGYANDPTVLVEVRRYGGGLYVKEWLYLDPNDPNNPYQSGGNTRELLQELQKLRERNVLSGNSIIYADKELRAISDLQENGYNIYPATKGAGSIKNGIDFIKSHDVYIDRTSSNIWLEYNFYKYRPDPKALAAGVYLNVPIDKHNHAIDAIRYANEEWSRNANTQLKTTL